MRSEVRHDSKLFRELSRSLLKKGISVRFLARGRSMFPVIADGETVQVDAREAACGDVLLLDTDDGLRVHRLQVSDVGHVVTRGDSCLDTEWSHWDAVYGRVSAVIGAEGARSTHRFAHYLRRLRQLLAF